MRASYSGGDPVCLQTLLESVGRVKTSASEPVYTCSCCSDPYHLKRGDVFFLLEGDDAPFALSPEETVALAQERGCAAVVAKRAVKGVRVPLFTTPKIREAFGVLCHAIYGNPGKKLKIIGITGTSGKTSTSYLIAGVLAESQHRVGLIGSLGIYDGEDMYAASHTHDATPSPDRLAYWLLRMEATGCTHAVIEVSSRALSLYSLSGLELDAVCITNIQKDHIDYHGSLSQYRRTKLGIFAYAKKDAIAILNADDKVTAAVLPLVENPTLTTSLKDTADLCAELVERHRSEQTFIVTAGSEAMPVRTRVIGDHHVANCLTAIGLGIAMDNDLKTSIRGLERVESVPGRLERLECGQPFGVFVDCAQAPESLASSLRTLREVTCGRLICLVGVNDQIYDGEEASRFGRAISLVADEAVLTVDMKRSTQSPEIIRAQVAEVVTAFDGGIEHHIFTDRATALSAVLSQMSPDDSILIVESHTADSGATGTEPPVLCDKLFVKQWLYQEQEAGAPSYTAMSFS